jgi:hypothetical protein
MISFSILLSAAGAHLTCNSTSQQYYPEHTGPGGMSGLAGVFKPSVPGLYTSGIAAYHLKTAQIFSVTGISGSAPSPYSRGSYSLLPWSEISKQPSYEQHLVRSALDQLVTGGINPLSIVEYNISVHDDLPKTDVYSIGFSLGTENISLEHQVGSISYPFEDGGYVADKMSIMAFSLLPAGEVAIESPYTAYQDPAMHIAGGNGASLPIFIDHVRPGYYLNKRPYNRGVLYEPAWIFYGIDRKGALVTEWVWASRDRGTDPLKDDLDHATAKRIIVHASESNQRSLPRDDPLFDTIDQESKIILRDIIAQCACFTTEKQKEEQKRNGSYVEVIFSNRTRVIFALKENPGPDDLVEVQIDGVLIAFEGPFGKMVYPYEYYPGKDHAIWGMWFSTRNFGFLQNLSNQALTESS